MFNMLYQYSQIARAQRSAQVWLPGDIAPTREWFPFAIPPSMPQLASIDEVSLARWTDDGGTRS